MNKLIELFTLLGSENPALDARLALEAARDALRDGHRKIEARHLAAALSNEDDKPTIH